MIFATLTRMMLRHGGLKRRCREGSRDDTNLEFDHGRLWIWIYKQHFLVTSGISSCQTSKNNDDCIEHDDI